MGSSIELTNSLRLAQCLQLPNDLPNDRPYVRFLTSEKVSSFMSRVLNRQVGTYECQIAHKRT